MCSDYRKGSLGCSWRSGLQCHQDPLQLICLMVCACYQTVYLSRFLHRARNSTTGGHRAPLSERISTLWSVSQAQKSSEGPGPSAGQVPTLPATRVQRMGAEGEGQRQLGPGWRVAGKTVLQGKGVIGTCCHCTYPFLLFMRPSWAGVCTHCGPQASPLRF